MVATGKSTSVRKFVEISFNFIGIKIIWREKGINEIGINKETGKKLIKIEKRLFRPNEVHFLKGNINKAKKKFKMETNN